MILLKIALQEIKAHKSRILIAFISLFLTTLALNIAASFKDSAMNTRYEQVRSLTLNTQIKISPAKSGTYFDPADAASKIDGIKNVTGMITRISEPVNTNLGTNSGTVLVGTDLKSQNRIYPFSLINGSAITDTTNGVIISEQFSKKYNLSMGSKFDISDQQNELEVSVQAIAKDQGVFETNENYLFVNNDTAQKLLSVQDKVSSLSLTIAKLADIDNTVDKVTAVLKGDGLTVQPTYDSQYFEAYVSTVVLALNLISIFLVIISIYVLFSFFKVITYEGMPQMAILRSLGLTKRQYLRILYTENILLVIFSSLIGTAISYFGVQRLIVFVVGTAGKAQVNLLFSLLITVLMLFVTVLSVFLSSYSVLKIPIVAILRKSILNTGNKHFTATLVGLIFLFFSIAFIFCSRFFNVYAYFVSIVFFIMAFIFLQSAIIHIFAWILKCLTSFYKGAKLSITQFYINYTHFLQPITIMAIVIALGFVSVNISFSISQALQGVYRNTDIVADIYGSNYQKAVDIIHGNKNISSLLVEQRKNETVDAINVTVSGVNVKQYIDSGNAPGKDANAFQKLNNGANVVITNTFSKKTGKHVNDKITIDGQSFTVVGIISSFDQMGKVLFISDDQFNSILQNCDYALCLINTSAKNTTQTVNDLSQQFDKISLNYSINTLQSIINSNNQSNSTVLDTIYALTLISLIISFISLVNSLVINMLARQKDFIVMRTVGVSRKRLFAAELEQVILMSLCSALSGIILGLILNPLVTTALTYYIGDIHTNIQVFSIPLILAAIVAVSILSAILILRRFLIKGLIENVMRIE